MKSRALPIAREPFPRVPIEHARRAPERLFTPGAAALVTLLGAASGFVMGVVVTITSIESAESFARGTQSPFARDGEKSVAPASGSAGVSREGLEAAEGDRWGGTEPPGSAAFGPGTITEVPSR